MANIGGIDPIDKDPQPMSKAILAKANATSSRKRPRSISRMSLPVPDDNAAFGRIGGS